MDNVFICQTEDIDGLAKAITKMVNDDVLRSRMQLNALARSRFFEIDNIIHRWEKLINSQIRKGAI